MKVISLFDGISCGRVALEKAGINVEEYISYEIDRSAIKISKKNWPDIVQKGDVELADFYKYEGYDLLIGGSPCQSLSLMMHNRDGLDGKSKLFFEFLRAKEEIKPKYFFFENVSSMDETSELVISELLGCTPIRINSEDFSAQYRPRSYWTNIPVNMNYEKSKELLCDILEDEVDEKYFYQDYKINNFDPTKVLVGYLDSISYRNTSSVYNTNAKIPTLLASGTGKNKAKKIYIDNKVRVLTPIECERLQNLPDNYTAGISESKRYSTLGNGWTVNVIAHIFSGLPDIYKKEI